MSGIARWSIAELQIRYELEPELTDVFVEGDFDRELLTQSQGCTTTRATIYEIDCIDVPMDTLTKYGLTTGNKQRVIALAHELATLPENAKVKCLVDRDLDHWFGQLSVSPKLRWSLYCSIESHFLENKCIEDILITTGRAKIKSPDTFIASLYLALKQLYALRLVDKELSLALKWPSLRKYLTRSADTINLNIDGYKHALLLVNSKGKQRASVDEHHTIWLSKLTCDIRMSTRGHDLTELLAWAMSEFRGHKEFASPKAIERLFVLLARSVTTLAQELQ